MFDSTNRKKPMTVSFWIAVTAISPFPRAQKTPSATISNYDEIAHESQCIGKQRRIPERTDLGKTVEGLG